MINNWIQHTFHDVATVAANGAALDVDGFKTLTVEVYGTSTSRNINFLGKGPSGATRSLPGCKMSGDTNFTMATSTTSTGEIWQFDITGLEYVLMDLTAVAGGNVSIKGRVLL